MTTATDGVFAAVIVGLVSIVTAAAGQRSRRQIERFRVEHRKDIELLRDELRSRAIQDDRQVQRETVMARYRQPLAMAAYDCHRRVHHILTNDFLGRYASPDASRREMAILTTVYRVAQYFCWAEILRQEIQLLQAPNTETTKRTNQLMNRIIKAFMSDRFGCPGFEIWRDQQRSIGELMIDETGRQRRCIGYFAFEKTYEERFAKLCGGMVQALEWPNGELLSPRLQLVQHLFCDLASHLDSAELQYEYDWHKKAETPLSSEEARTLIETLDGTDP